MKNSYKTVSSFILTIHNLRNTKYYPSTQNMRLNTYIYPSFALLLSYMLPMYKSVGYLFIIIMLLFDSMTCTCGFFNTYYTCVCTYLGYKTCVQACFCRKMCVLGRKCVPPLSWLGKGSPGPLDEWISLIKGPQPHNLIKHSPAPYKVSKSN